MAANLLFEKYDLVLCVCVSVCVFVFGCVCLYGVCVCMCVCARVRVCVECVYSVSVITLEINMVKYFWIMENDDRELGHLWSEYSEQNKYRLYLFWPSRSTHRSPISFPKLQHMSAQVSICQHTSANICLRFVNYNMKTIHTKTSVYMYCTCIFYFVQHKNINMRYKYSHLNLGITFFIISYVRSISMPTSSPKPQHFTFPYLLVYTLQKRRR